MSIIFQLFSAEDLQKLTEEELGKLREEIGTALDGLSTDDKLHLDLTNRTEKDSRSPAGLYENTQYETLVREALLKRFYEVSHQLKMPPIDVSQSSFDFDDLIKQRNNPEYAARDKLILEWAISCELNHLEFYFALLKAKEGVKTFYEKYPVAKAKLLTKEQRQGKNAIDFLKDNLEKLSGESVRTKDPDSLYSPYNPRHPGFKQYNNIRQAAPGAAEPPPTSNP